MVPNEISQEWSGTLIPLGAVLAERYQVVRLIARGGMGEVYEAHDLARETQIALKTLIAYSDQEEAIRQLRAEVELAHRVTHKCVCRTYDLGMHRSEFGGQVLFITMELITGRSLSERIRADGPLLESDACRVGLCILAGLEAAHDAGVLHRDLKSDNVMLRARQDGQLSPVLMDFGLSKALSASSTSASGDQTLAGTLAYMAPEQLQGRSPRVTTDLYAFGIVMFEVLTARLPFVASTPALAALKRLQEPAPPVRQFNDAVSPLLEQFVARCLDQNPAKRFRSAREASAELQRLAPEASRVPSTPPSAVLCAATHSLADLTPDWPPSQSGEGGAADDTSNPTMPAIDNANLIGDKGVARDVARSARLNPLRPSASQQPVRVLLGLLVLAVAALSFAQFVTRQPAPAPSRAPETTHGPAVKPPGSPEASPTTALQTPARQTTARQTTARQTTARQTTAPSTPSPAATRARPTRRAVVRRAKATGVSEAGSPVTSATSVLRSAAAGAASSVPTTAPSARPSGSVRRCPPGMLCPEPR